ncbi:MAG TPA: tRNA lysidine(34) synthetase TilS [Candidatus Saccharimonadales bacterium]|nr:tRNA lysidine(34) synthetase TilS [Candidatus Saccharimonadales bacterium]
MTNPILDSLIAWPPPGRYVVAVSGGGDSAALLDLLAQHSQASQWELVPAHFNHGWEGDDAYESTARAAIERYGLKARVGRGKVERSEAAARTARYRFLRQVLREEQAVAIITAHHRDDLEETMLLNLLRGSGRQGLAPFQHMPDVRRPLVGVRKAELKDYAQERQLVWCHDTYNDDLKFRRNYVRHRLIPKLKAQTPGIHEFLTATTQEAGGLNRGIDAGLARLFQVSGSRASLPRPRARQLEPAVLSELIVAMAGAVQPGVALDRRTVEQLAVDIKTGRLQRPRKLANSLFAEAAHDTVAIVFTP